MQNAKSALCYPSIFAFFILHFAFRICILHSESEYAVSLRLLPIALLTALLLAACGQPAPTLSTTAVPAAEAPTTAPAQATALPPATAQPTAAPALPAPTATTPLPPP